MALNMQQLYQIGGFYACGKYSDIKIAKKTPSFEGVFVIY
ncbi:hypothetical protein HMPREF9373_2031 [Psychrobacter sp. 1501(2011)]|nr:hypothetical protein HMPREF9373_2031 [Psychrobacter sp. 1501(2011)]